MPTSLPRRPLLGFVPGEYTARGLTIASVRAGSMIDRAGIHDVLTSIDGRSLRAPRDLRDALMSMGDIARLNDRETTVDRRPCEHGVEHGELDGKRTFVRGNSALGVLFLQGITPSSLEDPSPVTDALRSLENITLLELERRGVGDSRGQIPDFNTEVDDYRAALTWLRTRCRRVIVFGHSVGGMIAPLLDADAIVVYGTSSMRWMQCLEASTRRQCALRGIPDVESVLQRERARIARGEDERSAEFHAQLDAVDLADAWRRSRVPRLVLHGEYDWVVSEEEARAIGEPTILPSLDHAMTAHDSLHASLVAMGRGKRVPVPELQRFVEVVRSV